MKRAELAIIAFVEKPPVADNVLGAEDATPLVARTDEVARDDAPSPPPPEPACLET